MQNRIAMPTKIMSNVLQIRMEENLYKLMVPEESQRAPIEPQ
jgi:hypothetical protein